MTFRTGFHSVNTKLFEKKQEHPFYTVFDWWAIQCKLINSVTDPKGALMIIMVNCWTTASNYQASYPTQNIWDWFKIGVVLQANALNVNHPEQTCPGTNLAMPKIGLIPLPNLLSTKLDHCLLFRSCNDATNSWSNLCIWPGDVTLQHSFHIVNDKLWLYTLSNDSFWTIVILFVCLIKYFTVEVWPVMWEEYQMKTSLDMMA